MPYQLYISLHGRMPWNGSVLLGSGSGHDLPLMIQLTLIVCRLSSEDFLLLINLDENPLDLWCGKP